jgi:hypothetical protein
MHSRPAAERRRQDRPHHEHDTHSTAHVPLKVKHTYRSAGLGEDWFHIYVPRRDSIRVELKNTPAAGASDCLAKRYCFSSVPVV